MFFIIKSIMIFITSFHLIFHAILAYGLYNEGLPASYGQSDIEEAKIPDPTKRQPQSYQSPKQPIKHNASSVQEKSEENSDADDATISSQPKSAETPTVSNQISIEDESITDNLKASIATDPSLSTSTVVIYTKNGVVRLSGVVNNVNQRQSIEQIAKTMTGVKRVDNHITILEAGNAPSPIYITKP